MKENVSKTIHIDFSIRREKKLTKMRNAQILGLLRESLVL